MLKLKNMLRSIHQCLRAGRRRSTSTSDYHHPLDTKAENEDHCHAQYIPSSILIEHVFNFLDRKTQNNLCLASKRVHDAVQRLRIQQAWPHNTKHRIKKIVVAVCFSPSSDELAFVTTNSKVINVWNRKQGFEQILEGHYGQCSDVTYGNDFLVSSSRTDGTVRLWRRCGDRTYCNHRILNVRVFATLFVRVSADSHKIASFGDDGKIYLSNVQTGQLISTTDWRDRPFIDCYACVAFPASVHGQQQQYLAHTFNNQTVKIWNWETQIKISLDDHDPTRLTDYKAYITSIQFVQTDTCQENGAGCCDLGNDGCTAVKPEYLAVGCAVARVKLWRLEDYTCVRTFHLGSGWSAVTHLVFNADGTKMACTGDGSQIRVFDVESGGCIKRIDVHKQKVNTLAFSPDGTTLASGSNDRTFRLHAV